MKPTTFALSLLALLPLSAAYTCDFNNAIDLSGTLGDNSTDDSSFATKRAVLPQNAANPSLRSVTSYFQRRHAQARAVGAAAAAHLARRQSDFIDCTDSQTCYADSTEGSLLCVDTDTGDFSDNSGDSGNYNSGVITMADGSVTTVPGAADAFSSLSLSDLQTSAAESTGGPVTQTQGGATPSHSASASAGSGSGSQGNSQVTATATAKSTGGSPSVSGSSASGQPTGHVAGGAAGRAGVDVVAAMGALGLMAVVV